MLYAISIDYIAIKESCWYCLLYVSDIVYKSPPKGKEKCSLYCFISFCNNVIRTASLITNQNDKKRGQEKKV